MDLFSIEERPRIEKRFGIKKKRRPRSRKTKRKVGFRGFRVKIRALVKVKREKKKGVKQGKWCL